MVIAISFDWSKNFDENTGESRFNLDCPNTDHHDQFGRGWETAYEATEDQNGDKCEPYQGCPCCEDDSGYLSPMMNFIYPLDYQGLVTKEIQIELAQTNCILVEEEESGDYFLTLTGGGMDLSPAIAYAYYKAQKWLPLDLLHELKAGWVKDSLSTEKFEELKAVIVEQLENQIPRTKEKFEDWSKPTKEITQ